MKLNFLFPGKTREPFMAEGIKEYLHKLKPMIQVKEVILKGAAVPPGAGAAAETLAKAKEAGTILEHCGTSDYLIALDVAGELMSSVELSNKFEKLRDSSVRVVNVVVGGPWGLDESLIHRADLRLSLGPMTFPHELARVMILEQIYRTFTIINHMPYHK